MTTHLQLMSKPRLIAIIEDQAKRLDTATQTAAYWRSYADRLSNVRKPGAAGRTTVLEEAREILYRIGADPDAENHRDVLERELQAFSPTVGVLNNIRKPGPRCARPKCDKLLNEFGLCSRCQTRQTRRARAEVAA